MGLSSNQLNKKVRQRTQNTPVVELGTPLGGPRRCGVVCGKSGSEGKARSNVTPLNGEFKGCSKWGFSN